MKPSRIYVVKCQERRWQCTLDKIPPCTSQPSSVVFKAIHPVECRELGLAILIGHQCALLPCASRKILLASVILIFGLFVVLFVHSTSPVTLCETGERYQSQYRFVNLLESDLNKFLKSISTMILRPHRRPFEKISIENEAFAL